MSDDSGMTVFTVIDFVLAGVSALFASIFLFGLFYGVFLSGDRGGELAAGIFGSLVIIVPCVIGCGIYLVAGIGLLKRRNYGYYFHIVGSILAAFSCIGIIYTVVALIFAFKPEFRNEFPMQCVKGGAAQ
jgi:hypothetical protein